MITKDRRLVGIDLARLATQAEAANERLANVNTPNKERYGKLAGVVGTFCPGLVRQAYQTDRLGTPLN